MQYGLQCRKHPGNQVSFVCTKVNCNYGNLLCQQCINGNVQHKNEHKNYLNQLNEFIFQQNGKTKTVLIPNINSTLQELDKRLKEYNALIDKEAQEIVSDISQLFKIFYESSEKAKKQIQEIIRSDLCEQQAKNLNFKQQLQEIQSNEQKRIDNNNYLFNTIFSKDQDKELPISEQSLIQIINKNGNLNQLRCDILNCLNSVVNTLQPTSNRIRYKNTQNQQQQFNLLKNDFIQSLNCLFQKLTDLTQEFQSVEDMKRSLYQFGSLDGSQSLKQSQVVQRSLGSSQLISTGHQSQRFFRLDSQSQIMSVKTLEVFPPLSPTIQQILNKIGHLSPPQADSLLSNIEIVPPCQFPDGIIYEGQIQNNQRFGWGRAIIGQDYYEGYWRGGLPFGFGRIIMGSGDYYEGTSQNGKANGRGLFCSGGYSYEGDWEDDLKQGKGQELLNGKYEYKGDFKNNVKCGEGRLIDLLTGNVYQGEFQNDQLQGQTTIEYKNGDKYFGQVITVDGQIKRNGQGIYLWVDSRKYEGQYENDLEHGDGVFMWPDQWMYKGQWQCGMQHGKGIQYNPQGKEREGIWSNGQFNKWVS
ncbi:unnamed protein product (macronuclear) [Paramecium tetraurelia]|uniref:B box-type domain-containing protein n=1 Tax=Paramecium tetraurelia TaxID=5888 RepID=A0DV90_PARTE|nr:uncharacterized protein GSPATT00020621001 [Paramecium tetraurelia]CAK86957.1 unnamed protein product [Paramecium tetraurelia]|eukprot:XP_001454354.1 hypothetical protein (macronuclear) [Paramecium tetraurelia strain d4-2]